LTAANRRLRTGSCASRAHLRASALLMRDAVVALLAAAAPFAPIGADVGDRIIFNFPKGTHAVFAVPDERAWETCERSVFQARAGPQDTPFTFVVPAPGVYYFADPMGQHCEAGEKVKVVANAP
jgi:hypothetical protein